MSICKAASLISIFMLPGLTVVCAQLVATPIRGGDLSVRKAALSELRQSMRLATPASVTYSKSLLATASAAAAPASVVKMPSSALRRGVQSRIVERPTSTLSSSSDNVKVKSNRCHLLHLLESVLLPN